MSFACKPAIGYYAYYAQQPMQYIGIIAFWFQCYKTVLPNGSQHLTH